jgi:hypothetical protein
MPFHSHFFQEGERETQWRRHSGRVRRCCGPSQRWCPRAPRAPCAQHRLREGIAPAIAVGLLHLTARSDHTPMEHLQLVVARLLPSGPAQIRWLTTSCRSRSGGQRARSSRWQARSVQLWCAPANRHLQLPLHDKISAYASSL